MCRPHFEQTSKLKFERRIKNTNAEYNSHVSIAGESCFTDKSGAIVAIADFEYDVYYILISEEYPK